MRHIYSVTEAAEASSRLRTEGKQLVLAGGCFDILHKGHTTFLTEAKMHADALFVLLESDANIKRHKGKNRPIHAQADRAVILSSLRMVDAVVLLPEMNNDDAYDQVILALKPAIIATTEGDPHRSHKERQAKLVSGKVVDVTKRITDASTSRLANLLSKEL